MPTYAFTSMKALSPAQRKRLVESVTAIHSVEATAPRLPTRPSPDQMPTRGEELER